MKVRLRKSSKIALFISLFLVMVIGHSMVSETSVTFVMAMDTPEQDDIASWIDTEAVNITYSILPDTAAFKLSGKLNLNAKIQELNLPIYHDERAIVRAGTVPYSIFEFSQDFTSENIPVMHKGSPEFLRAYYEFGSITGMWNLGEISQIALSSNPVNTLGKLSPTFKVNSPDSLNKINALAKVMATSDNDTTAAGFTATGRDDFALDDIDGVDGNDQINASDSTYIQYSDEIDPDYRLYAEALSGNSSNGDFIKSSKYDEDDNRFIMLNGFQNFEEEGFLEIYRANKAALHSTASDVITSDRIVVLDYTAQDFNMSTYFKKEFRDNFLEDLDKAEADYENNLKIMGIQVGSKRMKVNALEFFNVPLLDGVGKVFSDARTMISAPLKKVGSAISGAIGGTVTKLGNLGGSVLSGAKGAVDWSVNQGKSLVRGLMSIPSAGAGIIKGGVDWVGKTATSIYNGGAKVIGGAISTGVGAIKSTGKFVADGVSQVISLPGKLLGGFGNILMYAALAIGGIAVLIIGAKLYNGRKNRAPDWRDNYDFDQRYRY